MQTFLLFTPTVSDRRGSQPHDPAIEASGLTALIRQTFSDLSLPPNVGGCTKLQQHRNNPDRFDLYFYSNVDSESYHVGGTYAASDIAVFERTDFEDVAETERASRQRLQEFARRLVSGELQQANYE